MRFLRSGGRIFIIFLKLIHKKKKFR
jgi:hypothetical protein